MKEHLLIRASAGTGKTFRLTHRLIALLTAGESPEHILASTFTRKAASEILRRLVGRVTEAALDGDERAALNAQLAKEPGARQLDAARARTVALELLAHLHRLEVRTLDAFFHQLARVHSWELDLPAGWSVATPADVGRLQADAVSRVLERADRGELLPLLEALAGGPPKSSVHADLLKKLREAHGLYLDAAPSAWTEIGAPEPPSERAIADAAARIAAFAPPMTKGGTPRRSWVSALEDAAAAVRSDDWATLCGRGLGKKVSEGEALFDSVPIPTELRAAVGTLLAVPAAAELKIAAARVAAWHRLLADFDAAFSALQRERRLLRFEDVPRALQRGGLPGADEAALAMRLDGALRHVLLDEFQDTSTLQWRVLAPLVDRALADPLRHVFAVGDPKQSIYGWRQGEPRLLDALEKRGVEVEDIAESRRGAPAVMRAVNDVFGRLPTSPAFGDDSMLLAAATRWHGAPDFPHHDTACKDRVGAVRLWEVPTPPGAKVAVRRPLVAEAAAELVARLAQADPTATVAVLVRTNDTIPRLLHALRQRGVLASGEGGNALTDSEAVLILLSLLRLADHPGDSFAAFHAATSDLGKAIEPALRVDFDRPATWAIAAEATRSALLARGYGAFLADRRSEVIGCGAFGAWDLRRVAQLVDLGHAWDARATLRPADFADFVRETKVEDPAASRIRVLTVHAAKGLEFDAVVCPELERNPFKGGEHGLIWSRSNPEADVDRLFLSVSRQVAATAQHASLQHLMDEVRKRTLREELCVLYVATTRAKRRVDLLVSASRPVKASFAAILRAALTKGAAPAAGPGESALLHEDTDPGDDPLLGRVLLAAQAAEPARAAPAARQALAAAIWREDDRRHALRRVAPSSREGGGRRRAAELLATTGRTARSYGLVAHAWMERIEWSEDPPPADDTLIEIARRLLRRAGEAVDDAALGSWLARWRTAVGRDKARDALSRTGALRRAGVEADVRGEVWRERRFLLVVREGREEILVPGAFDRVVLFRDAGNKPIAAEILDFKTDAVGTADRLEERVRHYEPQMEAYRRALAVAEPLLPRDRIACRLLFLDADVVREIDPAR